MKSIQELLRELTIPEKAALLEGYKSWMTNAIPRLGIPAIYLTDGPVGIRKKADDQGEGVMGLGKSEPSTAFPTAVTIANGWNPENAEKMGRAIGLESSGYNVQVLLGPALNLKRDPRCGRNFEYYSEDPLLAGRMAAAFVRGVQSTGTAATPKHFALNNSENFRYMSDSVVDERTARELYLKPFEICVREGKPQAMMCAYNKINGVHCSENGWLLTDVLRKEWGFDGMMMTDWGATRDRVAAVKAGLDLDMPGGIWENRKSIIDAATSGEITMAELDAAVTNVLRTIEFTAAQNKQQDMEILLRDHAALATDMATDCAVLLKNDGCLPLTHSQKLLVVGDLFEKMRYQGAGSSGLNPAHLTSPKAAFDAAGVDYTYIPGYHEMNSQRNISQEEAVMSAVEDYDTVLFFGGLTELFESEGFDRENLSMPENQLALLDLLCASGKKVIAVLYGGSPMELPFADKANAILHMFLPGEGGGEATRRILFGEADPAGRLSETWMKSCADIPYGTEFGKHKIEQYREGIFVGYRYYDLHPEKILYPFGFGLSYAQFAYSDMSIAHGDGKISVSCTVENISQVFGKEVVQLYVGKNATTQVSKAEKELKGYSKIALAPGEKQTVTIAIAETDLAYYHPKEGWVVENGEYPIYVGSSSRDLHLTGNITIQGKPTVAAPYSQLVVDAYAVPDCISDSAFAALLGHAIPQEPAIRPYTTESPLLDYQNSFMGKTIFGGFMKGLAGDSKKIEAMPEGPEKDAMVKNQQFVLNLVPRNSTRALIQSGGGRMQLNMARAITEIANGHLLRGIKEITAKQEILPLPCEEGTNA